jgi:hypothetical protein
MFCTYTELPQSSGLVGNQRDIYHAMVLTLIGNGGGFSPSTETCAKKPTFDHL